MATYAVTGSNIVINGGFEAATAAPWVNTTSAAGVEINTASTYGVSGPAGNKVLEIDNTAADLDTIAQTLTTVAGTTYTFTFDYAKRVNTTDESNVFNVLVNGAVVGTISPTSTTFASAKFVFEATSASTVISFAEPGSDGLGRIVDNVSVNATSVNGSNSVNLIKNGTFDVGGVGFTAANWTNLTAGTTGVEVNTPGFYGLTGTTSGQVMEIDNTDAYDTIAQTVATTVGKAYTFSFDYAKRADAQANNSSTFEVLVNGAVIDTIVPTSTALMTKSYTFLANSANTQVAFREIQSQSNFYGAVVDNVGLRETTIPNNPSQQADPNSKNLVTNFSFEDGNAGGTVPGWSNAGTNTFVSVDLATWDGVTGATGNQILQIDSTQALDTISQAIATTPGLQYTFTFNYAKPAGTTDASNAFNVLWNGKVIDTITPTSSTFTASKVYTVTGGDNATTVLSFAEVASGNDGRGGLVDNVSLVANATPIYLNAGADVIYGAPGNQFIQGNADLNTMVYATNQSAAAVSTVNGTTTVTTGAFGTDTLRSIERLQFNDGVLAFDVLGNMGDAYRLYEAAFNRLPDQGGLSYWTHLLDQNVSLVDIAKGFVRSEEFVKTYGGLSNQQIVDKFYLNILGRAGETDGTKFWVGKLDSGATLESVLRGFANSPENHTNIDPTLTGGIKLDTSAFLV